ncbi:MAG TPA: lysylphosphatidylglycerol synthase transmembrane domain-containing protein [Candidatus Limnocylindrales bacterium]|nr:lysylphosphatidylglycerol synthase transmembrane domain-containing protein [Candidatus Limnocylindrales bacterium]
MTRHTGKRRWLAAARIAGSVLALILLFHFLPLAEVWATLRRLPAYIWLLVLAGYLAAHVVGIVKWRLMVNLGGAQLNFRNAARCYFSGLLGTLFLPSILGGDVVRAGLALHVGKSKAGVLLGTFLARMLDFAALALLAALGIVLAPAALSPQTRRVFLIAGIAAALLLAIAAPIVLWFPARRTSLRMRRRMVHLRRAARSMRQQPQSVFAALCLALFVQGSFIWLMAQVARASGLRLPFRAWLFAWPLAKFCAVIPITQGGIGLREAALAALLVPFGARPAVTVAIGLAWETVVISGGLLAGLAALLLARLWVTNAASGGRSDAASETSSLPLR